GQAKAIDGLVGELLQGVHVKLLVAQDIDPGDILPAVEHQLRDRLALEIGQAIKVKVAVVELAGQTDGDAFLPGEVCDLPRRCAALGDELVEEVLRIDGQLLAAQVPCEQDGNQQGGGDGGTPF